MVIVCATVERKKNVQTLVWTDGLPESLNVKKDESNTVMGKDS